MKVALVTPYYHPAVRGNAVTVHRVSAYLELAGCEVRVFALDTLGAEEVLAGITAFAPDLLHAFHGYHGGRVVRQVARALGLPYVVTLTGTDLYEAAEDRRNSELHAVFREAGALVVFDRGMRKRLVDRFPLCVDKVRIIAQGVELPGDGCRGSVGLHCLEGSFRFLLPAGLRPVKNVLFPLPLLAELHREEPGLRFFLVGPILDVEFGARVLEELEAYPFARYLGAVGHDAMGCLYRQADVVLNTSHFEGGMANSIMEAMAMGRAVLAAAIEGNHVLVREGVTGFLYRDGAEFLNKAGRLVRDAELRQRLGEQGRRFVLDNFSPQREAAAYLELYRGLISAHPLVPETPAPAA
jgi:glycosyltransferase involved in cell wall biosynthesis